MFTERDDNEPSIRHKMLYIQAYVKFRKNVHIEPNIPRNYQEEALLDHMWREGIAYMASIGKKIRISVP